MNEDYIVARVTSQGVRFMLECIQGGHEDYNNPLNYGPGAKRDHTTSVAAACINCHIIERAKRMSVEMQGFIKIIQKRGRTTFILADYTEIWYKKLNKEGKPSFRPSQQALDYIEPPNTQLTLDIDSTPEKKRWVAGYKPTEGIDFEVLVAGTQETGERWAVSLSGTEVQELFPASVPTTTPVPVPAASTEFIKKRVRVRTAKEAKVIGNEFNE